MPFRNDEYPYSICPHPEDRVEFRRDVQMRRWVGRCTKCGCGPNEGSMMPPIIRTDEQIARGEAPDVAYINHFIADTMPSSHIQPPPAVRPNR